MALNIGRPGNLIEMMRLRAELEPERNAFTFLSYEDGKEREFSMSYQHVDREAKRVAQYLVERGLKNGDRVVILSTQTPDNIYSIFGSIYAGAIFMIVPPPVDANKRLRFKSVLESSEARFILTTEEIVKKLENGIFPHYIPASFSRWIMRFVKDLEMVPVDKCPGAQEFWNSPEIDGNSVAYLQYSSGSIATPKGVVVRHRNVLSNLMSTAEALPEIAGENSVSWVPFFHNMGLIGNVFLSAFMGYRSVVMSPIDFMEKPVRWFEALSKYQAVITSAPNSAYRMCANSIKEGELGGIDLSNLRYAVNGAEPIAASTLRAFEEKFRKTGFAYDSFTPGYGLAEAACVVSVARNPEIRRVDPVRLEENLLEDFSQEMTGGKELVSVGSLIPGFEGVVVDPETGNPCEENRIGEIWLKGDSVADSYWKQAQETEKTFSGRLEDGRSGFLRTGDLGIIKDGMLFITGRLKELIIINGHNFYPHDIETTLKESIPELMECTIACFSVFRNGREGVVAVVEGDLEWDLSDLQTKIESGFSAEYRLKPWETIFVRRGTLPRTDNLKIRLLEVKSIYENGELQSVDLSQAGKSEAVISEDVILFQISQIVSKTLGVERVSGKDDFFLLGGDSLYLPQLVEKVREKYGVEVPISLFLKNPTVRNLSQIVGNLTKGIVLHDEGIDLEKECELDDSIRPKGYLKTKEEKSILLTGATGFLGAYLLHDLLETRPEARICCLVRSGEYPVERIRENMSYYKLWQSKFGARIEAVSGDFSRPGLGLSKDMYDRLSAEMDTVYHCGAEVNFIQPYGILKNPNVNGIIEIIKFAVCTKLKRINYISTLGLFDIPSFFGKKAMECELPERWSEYGVGYLQSKWVAEKIVKIARERGIPVTVFRPAEISGSSDSGIWKVKDMVIRFILTSLRMGMIPDLPGKIALTPVDYVSRSVVELSRRNDSIGKTFHIVNKNILTLGEIADLLESHGLSLKKVTIQRWTETFLSSKENLPLKPLQSFFTQNETLIDLYSGNQPDYSVRNTVQLLNGSGIFCPPVDRRLLFSYLEHFVEMGYVEGK